MNVISGEVFVRRRGEAMRDRKSGIMGLSSRKIEIAKINETPLLSYADVVTSIKSL